MKSNLTPKQKNFLDFIVNFTRRNGYSPSQEEIRQHFDFRSLGHVQHFIIQLRRKGFLEGEIGATRGLGVVLDESPKPAETEVALLGKVAAGKPLESSFNQEFLPVPLTMLKKKGDYFALQVQGDSMIDEGIHDGDYLVLRKQNRAENGQIVVAYIDGGATVKTFYSKSSGVELRPANPKHKILYVEEGQDFRIEGVLSGLLRLYS